MEFSTSFLMFTVGAFVLFLVGLLTLVRFFQKVEQGKALIVNTMRAEPVVTFTGKIVLPVIHKAEVMDISLKSIEIDRRGHEGLICKDNIRADIKVAFFVRVNKTQEDVLKVAQAIGCARASDKSTLEELFNAKFSEALKTVGKQLDFEDLYKERDSFRDKIIEVIGKDLNGYVLEDAAIDYLEQTPLSSLDAHNILDAQGIRKITELTAEQHVLTNEFSNQEKMRITQQNVTAREAILELERREADAEAKQKREIANVQAREQAEIDSVASEERKRAEQARLQTEEELEVREKNKLREVEVAEQNRLRVVSIEEERVKLAREQEAIAREREVELQRIAKEKAIEEEKREIANVIRERIVVEKTVAEEEERIKELRAVAEAERMKKVKITQAEAEAQEILVKDIKAAEASQQASEFQVREQLARAEAEREVAEKQAQAKIRLAEGLQAEAAAQGLADVRVKEANALAIEKEGAAQAKALLDKMQAEAQGKEQQGLATVRVKEANAQAVEKEGAAEAKSLEARLLAEAQGKEQQGLADVRVQEALAQAEEKRGMAQVHIKEADADAEEKQGLARAKAHQAYLNAEAAGLVEKFKALDALSAEGREHEEFRVRLEKELETVKVRMDAQKEMAAHQAQVLSEGLKNANIDIVGGDNLFFERMLNATSMGKSVDRFVGGSETVQHVLKDYLDGEGNLPQDLKEILSNPAISSQDVSNLTMSAFLTNFMKNSTPEQRNKLQSLLQNL